MGRWIEKEWWRRLERNKQAGGQAGTMEETALLYKYLSFQKRSRWCGRETITCGSNPLFNVP